MQDLLPFERIKREVFIKGSTETNLDYGKDPEERSVEELINYGIINLNKPSGPTSHQISDYVQKILEINKSGHSGTLDPGVTGVLPVALGKATRIVQTLLKSGKEYICLMHLHKDVDKDLIKKVFDDFQGKIEQLPPIRSAVKRQLRTREIYYLEILEINDKEVLFKVGCEAGTYIRKLCYDIGIKLKTQANMFQLVRTKAGPFTYKTWYTLHDLKDAYYLYKTENKEEEIRKIILPIEKAIEHLPKIWVNDSAVGTLCHGADLSIPGISKYSNFNENETVAVLTLKNELVCLGESLTNHEFVKNNERGKIIKTTKVFMERSLYPKK